MNFPARDLTDQYISSSYQDVLQQYLSGSEVSVLDGLGNLVFTLPHLSASVIVSSQTSSMTVLSSSYALTASYVQSCVFGNLDGGFPDSIYGGTTPVNGGYV